MNVLNEELGKPLSIKDVAAYLGLDPETVRRHCIELGGIRLGRRILFFEKQIVIAIQEKRNALQAETQEQGGMGCGSNAVREASLQSMQNKEGCFELGSGNPQRSRRKPVDPYGLLDSD